MSQTSLQLFIDALGASNTDIEDLEELASKALAEAQSVGLLHQISPLVRDRINTRQEWDACFGPMSSPVGRHHAGKPSVNTLLQKRQRIASELRRYAMVIQGNANAVMPSDESESDYAPGEWFTLSTNIPTARLRQAASPKRKKMRVRSKRIDGRPWYSKEDARRWWPNDWIKP